MLDGLVVVVQRFGLEDWRAGARLRSWGVAPLHREGDDVLVPCEPHEALWLGLTCEDETPCSGQASLNDVLTGAEGTTQIPDDYQLGHLSTADVTEPIRLAPGHTERRLRLEFGSEPDRVSVELVLLRPQAWCDRSGREPPPALERPPLPPLLG